MDRERMVRQIAARVRDVPDFPSPGILFRDITPVLQDPETYRACIRLFTEHFHNRGIQIFAGIESRGFLFAAPVALELGAGFVPIRKFGKLPADKVRRTYSLEYGEATIEIHRDAIQPRQKVAVLDDLLATGGTAQAACELVEELGGEVLEAAFLIELEFLNGRERMQQRKVTSFIRY